MSFVLPNIAIDYNDIAKIIHKKDMYSRIPIDVVDEIVELAKMQEVTDIQHKANILLTYFDHALKHRVVKKFELNNKQKQLLFCAVHFLDLFLENATEKHKDVSALYDVLSRIGTRHHKEIEQQMTYAYQQFAKITGEKDVLCNQLVLATTTAVYFARNSNIDLKLKNKILKLSNKIFSAVDSTEGDDVGFENSCAVTMRFCEKHTEYSDAILKKINIGEKNV